MPVLELTVSHYMPTSHGTHRDFIAPWARDVERRADGALRVVVHSGETSFGNLTRQFEQVWSGQVDAAHSPASLPPGRFPLTGLISLPFLCSNAAEGTALLWALYRRGLLPEFSGLKVLALHADSGGLLHTRNGPVTTAEDLAGLRLRTPSGPLADALTELGAVPVILHPTEIHEAARTGAIDGAVMAWDVLAYTQTADIFRFHTDTKLFVSPLYFVMNQARYESLPEMAGAAIDAASGDPLVQKLSEWWQDWEAPGRALALAPGHVTVTLEENELARWRAITAASRETYLDRVIAAGATSARDVHQTALALLRDGLRRT